MFFIEPHLFPFLTNGYIHINFHLKIFKETRSIPQNKKRLQLQQQKNGNMLEAPKWGLKHGCSQAFEKLKLRCQFTMSFFLPETYFKMFNFFLAKLSKIYNIHMCKYLSK